MIYFLISNYICINVHKYDILTQKWNKLLTFLKSNINYALYANPLNQKPATLIWSRHRFQICSSQKPSRLQSRFESETLTSHKILKYKIYALQAYELGPTPRSEGPTHRHRAQTFRSYGLEPPDPEIWSSRPQIHRSGAPNPRICSSRSLNLKLQTYESGSKPSDPEIWSLKPKNLEL